MIEPLLEQYNSAWETANILEQMKLDKPIREIQIQIALSVYWTHHEHPDIIQEIFKQQ